MTEDYRKTRGARCAATPDRDPSGAAYAMAYVRDQTLAGGVYEPEAALSAGTLFPSLNKPFYGSRRSANVCRRTLI